MARGPKKHLKRLNAPKHWMLDKMGGVWAPRPSTGPHKLRESLPLILILRNRLHYALNAREVLKIVMEKNIKVDGKIRTDPRFPAGFMDVVTIEKTNDQFRLMYNTKGKFVLKRTSEDQAKYKLAKVVSTRVGNKKVPMLTTHDGRTIRYPDPVIKVLDTVKIDISTGKISDFIKFDLGVLVMVTNGRNTGRIGTLTHRERHLGSFDIVTVKDANGDEFTTRLGNVFVIGKDAKTPWIDFPKRKGIKYNIIQEREMKQKKQNRNRRR